MILVSLVLIVLLSTPALTVTRYPDKTPLIRLAWIAENEIRIDVEVCDVTLLIAGAAEGTV